MSTQLIKKYQFHKFWDDEFKHLLYRHEEFNDPDNLKQWTDAGYSNRFTGDMCDMRSQQPSWNQRFVDIFLGKGWKDIGTSYYRMSTGTVLPTHSDLYKKYVELSTLCGLNFLPAVFESTGRMSPDLLRFLSVLSEAAEPEWKINKGIILQYWLKLISCNLQRSLSDSLLRRTAIIKGTFGSHSMSNYLQDSREEIIAIARGHGLPISAVTACNTSSVFAAGIISNSRYRTKRSAECHSFDNI